MPKVKEPLPETKSLIQLSTPWQVIVWDDPVNLMNYVVFVFRFVFGYTEKKARDLMLSVHEKGKAVVWTGEQERAEMYVLQMHSYQLKASLEKTQP